MPSRFKGDPGRIRQVLTSLLDNAIKYTAEGGVTLQVDIQPGGGDRTIVAFEVMDTGIGISESRREQLFASFSPSGRETIRPSDQNRPGAFHRQAIVRDDGRPPPSGKPLGGRVQRQFHDPPGTSLAEEDRILTAVGDDLAELRVLVVDDSLTHRNTLEKQLKALGCRCEGVPDGWRAIDALRKAQSSGDPFQIAIVDTALPDMSGETIGEKIKRDPRIRDTRLMMIAVIGRRGDARKFQDIGFSAYLLKPLKPGQLIDSLRLVMGRAPAAPSGDSPEIITRHTLMENRKNNVRILFIEPDPTMQAAGCGLLKNLGYHADPVQSREEAMLRMEYHSYDLVITEMMLPELDGYEMIRRIRGSRGLATSADVPVLCLVASGPGGRAEEAIQCRRRRHPGKAFRGRRAGKDDRADAEAPFPLRRTASVGNIRRKMAPGAAGRPRGDGSALIRGFMEKTPAHLRKLKEHTRAKNSDRIRTLGAILKGMSSAVGAHALYRIAFQIEAAGQNAAYSLMPGLIRKMETAFEDLKKAMASSPLDILPLPSEARPGQYEGRPRDLQ